MTRDDLRAALSNPNVAAFLRVIRAGESSQREDAYSIQYGGKHFLAPPWDHPRKAVAAGGHVSTAAGAYQFLAATWDAVQARYQFPDFSPQCQDQAAVALIHGRKALDDVRAGNFDAAIAKCGKEWASLPGSPYGQHTLTMDEARDIYTRWGGRFDASSQIERGAPNLQGSPAPEFDPDSLAGENYEGREPYQYTPPAPRKDATMPAPAFAIFSALLPTIVDLIPALAQVFKPGSEVAQRNVAAATIVTKAINEATQSPNLQAAIEKMQDDPEAVRRATSAVTAPDVWGQLVEPGPGVEAARKAAADPGQLPAWKNPAVWFMAAFIPLVYGTAYLVLTGDFSNDARMMVVTAIFSGLLASGTAFFLGSSLGSQRKTNMLAGKE